MYVDIIHFLIRQIIKFRKTLLLKLSTKSL